MASGFAAWDKQISRGVSNLEMFFNASFPRTVCDRWLRKHNSISLGTSTEKLRRSMYGHGRTVWKRLNSECSEAGVDVMISGSSRPEENVEGSASSHNFGRVRMCCMGWKVARESFSKLGIAF